MFANYFFKFTRRARLFPITWWVAVIGVAITAGFLVTTALTKADAAAARYDGLTTAYVTTHDIKLGTLLTPDDVAKQSRPRSFMPHEAITDFAVGAVTTSDLAANDVITTRNTGSAGLSPTAALLRADEVGIAVPTDEKSPDFQVGDQVAVFATITTTDDPSGAAPTVVLTQTARIIHLSDHAATVAVALDDAAKVAFALAKGSVTVAITAARN